MRLKRGIVNVNSTWWLFVHFILIVSDGLYLYLSGMITAAKTAFFMLVNHSPRDLQGFRRFSQHPVWLYCAGKMRSIDFIKYL